MGPETLGILIPIFGVVGGVILIGLKMTLSHLQDAREQKDISGSAQQEVERLTEAVDNLNGEFGLMRDELLALNERVDFTERLLEPPKTEE